VINAAPTYPKHAIISRCGIASVLHSMRMTLSLRDHDETLGCFDLLATQQKALAGPLRRRTLDLDCQHASAGPFEHETASAWAEVR